MWISRFNGTFCDARIARMYFKCYFSVKTCWNVMFKCSFWGSWREKKIFQFYLFAQLQVEYEKLPYGKAYVEILRSDGAVLLHTSCQYMFYKLLQVKLCMYVQYMGACINTYSTWYMCNFTCNIQKMCIHLNHSCILCKYAVNIFLIHVWMESVFYKHAPIYFIVVYMFVVCVFVFTWCFHMEMDLFHIPVVSTNDSSPVPSV